MPYKDREQQKDAQRKAMARRRNVNPTDTQSCEPCENVNPNPSDGWPDVQAYILRDSPRMANLERLQRIAGSLGKYADDVWFGISGLTMQDIGDVIGTKEPLY